MPICAEPLEPDFSQYSRAWARDLADLRQNNLLTEQGFLQSARDRGIWVSDTHSGSPVALYRERFLSADDSRREEVFFHPLRLHVVERSLALGARITPGGEKVVVEAETVVTVDLKVR